MGIFSKLKRDWSNAGAHVLVSLSVVNNLDHRENLPLPWFSCECTGLELHNFANGARKDMLKILNSDSAHFRGIKIPDDYWWFSTILINRVYPKHPETVPDQFYESVRDASCLLVECAFDSFADGDGLSAYLFTNGEVWVERLRMHGEVELLKKFLGNVPTEQNNA